MSGDDGREFTSDDLLRLWRLLPPPLQAELRRVMVLLERAPELGERAAQRFAQKARQWALCHPLPPQDDDET